MDNIGCSAVSDEYLRALGVLDTDSYDQAIIKIIKSTAMTTEWLEYYTKEMPKDG